MTSGTLKLRNGEITLKIFKKLTIVNTYQNKKQITSFLEKGRHSKVLKVQKYRKY